MSNRLKKLKRESEDIERDVPGLWAYLSTFDSEELLATTDMVVMPTLVNRSELVSHVIIIIITATGRL